MLRRVALVRTDVSEELSASFINVARIGELGTTLAVTSDRRVLRAEPIKMRRSVELTPAVVILYVAGGKNVHHSYRLATMALTNSDEGIAAATA
jgi:hypothetical protein